MDDLRLGATVRSIRIRRGLRQDDLAAMANVPRTKIGAIEHGHLDTVQLGSLRRVCRELEIRVDLIPRWRGGDLKRMLSSRHAALAEAVIQTLRAAPRIGRSCPRCRFRSRANAASWTCWRGTLAGGRC